MVPHIFPDPAAMQARLQSIPIGQRIALALAEAGFLVDWHATQMIAGAALDLALSLRGRGARAVG